MRIMVDCLASSQRLASGLHLNSENSHESTALASLSDASGASEEGTFYCNCGALWVLQVFSESGKTLTEVEQEHVKEAARRRAEREKEWEKAFDDAELDEVALDEE